MILNKLSFNIDWLIDILLDLEADLVRIACQQNPRRKEVKAVSRHLDKITQGYRPEDMHKDIEVLNLDLIISDIVVPTGGVKFARVGKIGLGMRPSLDYVEYLENIIRLPNDEGWKKGGML